jgi:hypothetical protein
MGWAKSATQEIVSRDREAAMYLVKVSHTGNYTTGGGASLDYSDKFAEIAAVIPLDEKTYKLVPSIEAGSTNKVILKTEYFEYSAADGPRIEYPNATALTVTDATLLIIGRRTGKYPPEIVGS